MVHPVTAGLLHNFYAGIYSLREYLERLGISVTDADQAVIPKLLDGMIVALQHEASPHPSINCSGSQGTVDKLVKKCQVDILTSNGGKASRNVLTMGFQFASSGVKQSNAFVNTTMASFRDDEWRHLLERTGQNVVRHLLSNCTLFLPLPNECYCQLTGTPINDINSTSSFVTNSSSRPVVGGLKRPGDSVTHSRPKKKAKLTVTSSSFRTAADTVFNRSGIFYSRPQTAGINNRLVVGLPRLHPMNNLKRKVLSSKSDAQSSALFLPSGANATSASASRELLQHIFPRQFKLPCVFTPTASNKSDSKTSEDMALNLRTPRRLEAVVPLASDLLDRHSKCTYAALRGRHCPSKLDLHPTASQQPGAILELMSESSFLKTQATFYNTPNDISVDIDNSGSKASTLSSLLHASKTKPRFTEFVCSHFEVFAFAKAVTCVVIPDEFWGSRANRDSVLEHLWQFIKARRFETMTLHAVLQGLNISAFEWAGPASSPKQRPNAADSIKCRQLVEDFVFWYFDGFIIPLIKTTFYATESSAYRNRVLYFRHDDWKRLCQPLLERLTEATFELLNNDEVAEVMEGRIMGASFVRLLPKDTGVRALVNLSFRTADPEVARAKSINQLLQATFQILSFEKNNHPSFMGASSFGVDDTYMKLKAFRNDIMRRHGNIPKLYFVKVDVKACFDSINQSKLLEILSNILTRDEYSVQRFIQVNPTAGRMRKSARKVARPTGEHVHFIQLATELAQLLRHSVFVDQAVSATETREELLALLREHITCNVVKVDNQYYRQRVGIPQGSAISTLLCNFFYGDLERKSLRFTTEPGSVLLRYVDDYCYITTEVSNAHRFLGAMTAGHPEYGAFIVPEKTLTNFDYGIALSQRTAAIQKRFPWCGLLIDMSTLSISVDYGRYKSAHLGDFLTVDAKRKPHKTFLHKMLRMAKHKTHAIYCDTNLSSRFTVYLNIYQNFLLSAMKMHRYLTELRNHRPSELVIYDVIRQTIRFTQVALKHSTKHGVARRYRASCGAARTTIAWLGWQAFDFILRRKPSAYPTILPMIQVELRINSCGPGTSFRRKFSNVVRRAHADFADIVY